MQIFGEHAARYWAAGFSVIPLRYRDKRPFLEKWQRFYDHLPTEADQADWIKKYGPNNMGVVLGPQSNLSVIDIDTEDQKIIEAIINALPPEAGTWCRIGAKGMVLAFQFNGLTTFRIKDKNNKTIVEYLSSETQVVLPPSIHPDTQKPYVANIELTEVKGDLVKLPQNIEDILRTALAEAGVELGEKSGTNTSRFKASDLIPAGSRDTMMNRNAGFQAGLVLRGEISLLQAMSNMESWYDMNVEKVSGDELDVNKGCQQIVGYLISDVTLKGKMLPPGWDDNMTEEMKTEWGLSFEEDQEEWTVDQILEYNHKVFSSSPKGDPKRHECVKYILTKMAKSLKLTSLDHDRILASLKVGADYTLPSLRKQLKELQSGPIEGLSHTQIALRVIKELHDKGFILRYQGSNFWSWTGTHWEIYEEALIWQFIAIEFGDLPAAKKANDHSGIMKVMAALLPHKLSDVEVSGVNFRNGFLNDQLELVPHAMEFGMTYVMPFNYDPSKAGRAFKFEQFLRDCWGSDPDFEEKRQGLREAIAVTMFGSGTSMQRAILLHGVGGSGKSTMLEIIREMVPPQATCAFSPEKWSETYNLANFYGKLLNIAGELHKDKPLPGKEFKEIITGDMITARDLYKSNFTFRPRLTHWFASNFLPKSRDTSNGFNRRWLIFDFPKPVAAGKKIPEFHKIIISEEMDAIIAWAVECYPELMKRGEYTLSESHKDMAETMGLANSTIRQWMHQNLEEASGQKTTEKALFNNYFNWCNSVAHTKNISEANFMLELHQFLAEQGRNIFIKAGAATIFTNLKIKETKNGK